MLKLLSGRIVGSLPSIYLNFGVMGQFPRSEWAKKTVRYGQADRRTLTSRTTDKLTDRQADTDNLTDRLKDRSMGRSIDKQTDRQTTR